MVRFSGRFIVRVGVNCLWKYGIFVGINSSTVLTVRHRNYSLYNYMDQ